MTNVKSAMDTMRFLWAQRVTGLESPGEPHFDTESTARFVDELSQAKSYLEFGSGGSTVAADRLGIPVVSIESDRFYAKAVRKVLRANTRVDLVAVNIGITRVWGFPLFMRPFAWRLRRWRRYVETPFARLTSFPDLVLVDGRFRVACALESARRAKQAGARAVLMFDDYVGRSEYHIVEQWLGTPERVGRAAFFTLGDADVPVTAVDRFARIPL